MSKLINCKSCSNEIAYSAKSCPNCGAKNKKPFYKRGWFIALVIIIILGAIGESENNDTTTIKNNETTEVEQVSNEKDQTTEEVSSENQEVEVEEVESNDVELLSYESVKSQAITILEEKFGKNGEVLVYEESDVILFSIPSPDGIVEGIFAINSGVANDELIESYEYMKESLMGLSERLFELGQTCGMNFALGLQNNKNPDNLLLTILNGVVINEVAEY